MQLTQVDPRDPALVEGVVAVRNAVNAVDAPWLLPRTARGVTADLTWGWDGEPDTAWLGTVGGRPVAVGTLSTSERDNLHLAWLGVRVHPEHRRRGLGSRLLEAMLAEARRRGRTTFGADAWVGEASEAFAARHGFAVAGRAVNRRQVLADVDREAVKQLVDEARPHAADYELVRRRGATPPDELDALAELTASINDAPTDDLDIEDEVFTGDRIAAYEEAQLARGGRLYRVLARHRVTGELGGHTVVLVDADHPTHGEQHDTAVSRSHRGHRLGLLLKAEMNDWLREQEPQLVEVDTWNAESNAQMIGVNELLGYRVLGIEHQFQLKDPHD